MCEWGGASFKKASCIIWMAHVKCNEKFWKKLKQLPLLCPVLWFLPQVHQRSDHYVHVRIRLQISGVLSVLKHKNFRNRSNSTETEVNSLRGRITVPRRTLIVLSVNLLIWPLLTNQELFAGQLFWRLTVRDTSLYFLGKWAFPIHLSQLYHKDKWATKDQ